ncbi:membrane protein [Streptomyces fumigatiscleroticus]|nr:membrane protein [Streptomyces fumigatiscleroticus]
MNPDTVPARARGGPGRTAVPAGVLAAVAAAMAYVGTVDPNEPGHYPVCPLLRLTGVYCPGCGGLRSVHALVHGDVLAALRDNAVAVAGVLGFAVLWSVWMLRAVRGRPLRIDPAPVALWTAGLSLLVFTVVRNLPFGGWLHP